MSERTEYHKGTGINFEDSASEASLHNMSPKEFADWLAKQNSDIGVTEMIPKKDRRIPDEGELKKAA